MTPIFVVFVISCMLPAILTKPLVQMTLNYFCCHQDLLLTRIYLFLFDIEIVESSNTGVSDALGVGKMEPKSTASPVDTLTDT